MGTRIGCHWGHGAELFLASAASHLPDGAFSKRTSGIKKEKKISIVQKSKELFFWPALDAAVRIWQADLSLCCDKGEVTFEPFSF